MRGYQSQQAADEWKGAQSPDCPDAHSLPLPRECGRINVATHPRILAFRPPWHPAPTYRFGQQAALSYGEWLLDEWMAEHAFVSWVAHPAPWVLEDDLIATFDLPLNLMGNGHNAYHARLSRARSYSRARAFELPVLPNTGRRPPLRF